MARHTVFEWRVGAVVQDPWWFVRHPFMSYEKGWFRVLWFEFKPKK